MVYYIARSAKWRDAGRKSDMRPIQKRYPQTCRQKEKKKTNVEPHTFALITFSLSDGAKGQLRAANHSVGWFRNLFFSYSEWVQDLQRLARMVQRIIFNYDPFFCTHANVFIKPII